jgi:hypothetical protein
MWANVPVVLSITAAACRLLVLGSIVNVCMVPAGENHSAILMDVCVCGHCASDVGCCRVPVVCCAAVAAGY